MYNNYSIIIIIIKQQVKFMQPYLSIYDFLQNEKDFFNMWKYEDDILIIIRLSQHIHHYYILDHRMYCNCDNHHIMAMKRITRSLRDIFKFHLNIIANFKQVLVDIVFLNTN